GNSTGPRRPLAPICTCAIVAGLFIPSNVPLIVSAEPFSVATTDPVPLMLAAVDVSTGTGERRALKLVGCGFADWARTRMADAISFIPPTTYNQGLAADNDVRQVGAGGGSFLPPVPPLPSPEPRMPSPEL